MSPAVDAVRVRRRLERLEQLCAEPDRAAALATAAVVGDRDLVAATERRLQVAVQAAIDVAAHLVAASAIPTPEGYAGTFRALAHAGVLDAGLAGRLVQATGLRNLLVHDYLEVDPARLHAGLAADVADLRAFVASVSRWLATA